MCIIVIYHSFTYHLSSKFFYMYKDLASFTKVIFYWY